MDSILLWTMLMIFAGAVIGMVIRYRTRDKCLKAFAGFFAVVEQTDGKTIWGRLDLYHNAIELVYPAPHVDAEDLHQETSFILYKDQFPSIYAVKRYHDELSETDQCRRAEEIRRTYRPNMYRRLVRRFRNLLNLLRDAIVQAFGAFMGSVKKTASSTLLATQDARITDTAKTLIMSSASAYEPILERYIGRKVVLETINSEPVREFCGILKDYTEEFICVLDVPSSEVHTFHLSDPEQLKINHDLVFDVQTADSEEDGNIFLSFDIMIGNEGEKSVRVVRAEANEFVQELDVHLQPGHSTVVHLRGVPSQRGEQDDQTRPSDVPDVLLMIHAQRFVDLVVPRSRGIIRHGAEHIS